MRERYGYRAGERRADAPLVLGVGIRVQQTHRDRLDTGSDDPPKELVELLIQQRPADASVGSAALVELERQFGRHDGGDSRGTAEIVEVVARLARDVQHVGEAACRHQRRTCEAAFEDGVRDLRGAVHDERFAGDAELHDRPGEALGSGVAGQLRRAHGGGPRRPRDNVGEGAARVDSDTPPGSCVGHLAEAHGWVVGPAVGWQRRSHQVTFVMMFEIWGARG